MGVYRNVLAGLIAVAIGSALSVCAASGASADSPGSITGTVTTADDPPAAGTVTAELYDDASLPPLLTSPVDATGSYAFSNLAAGSYKLRFVVSGPLASDYPAEWWEDQPLASNAASIVVAAGQDVSLAVAQLDREPLPTITGPPVVGQPLTASVGSWSPLPDSFAYSWYQDDVLIAGADQPEYILAPTDASRHIHVMVTAFRSGRDPVDRASADTDAVATAGFGNADRPVITGTAQYGQTLSVAALAWTPTPTQVQYQWTNDGVAIPDATTPTYQLGLGDIGHHVAVTVAGQAQGYATTLTSAATAAVAPLVFNPTPIPTISGTTTVGQLLTANAGSWDPAATLAYQWYRSGIAIPGAISHTYRLAVADGGTPIALKVSASALGFAPISTLSALTPPITRLLTTAAPRITGLARYGQTLTANPGVWGPAGLTVRYQWYVGTARIAGATARTYRLSIGTIGKGVFVAVTGSKPGYLTAVRDSASVKITGLPFKYVPTPKIVGTATVGAVLKVSMAASSPAATLYFQWRLNGVNIARAIGPSFRVRPTDVDRRFSVVVTAAHGGYANVARGSASTAPVRGQAFPNCVALNRVYPHGVARIGVRYDRVSGVNKPLKGPPFFSTSLYNLNPNRDGDKDGIACER
ncbi:MAG TPA: hypothetical protein VGH11_06260 [Jatrophihabitans sp.]|jgi:hypothetical protein